MRPDGPTKAEADYLVAERKYIKRYPEIVEGEREWRMKAVVYRAALPNRPIGLLLVATAKKSPPGIPRPTPSSALELGGRFRIRGLNYAVQHDCPSGPIVYGWHEHIWTNEHQDHVVIPARPHPSDGIRGMFDWGLRKWNIEVGEPRRGKHGKKK